MKTKTAILTVLLACAALPLQGNEAPAAFNPIATQPAGQTSASPAPAVAPSAGGGFSGQNVQLLPAPSLAGAGGGMGFAESPSGTASVEIKIRQIELDVALKQYEKIATALAEAQYSMELLDSHEFTDVQLREKRGRAEEKLARLAQIKDRLREEIMRTDTELEALRKKSGTTADAPVPAVGGFGLAPGSARR